MSEPTSTHSPFNVVIPVVAGIGNALMAVPMVRQLRAGLPDARVRVVASLAAMVEPFIRLRGVEGVVAGKGSWKLFTALRASAPIDVLVVPFPSNRWQYNVLAARSGAKRVIMHSYPAGNRAWLSGVGQRIEAVRGIHDVEQNLRLLEPLGIKPQPGEAPGFAVRKEDEAVADDLLRKAGVDDRRPYVAVHAGSARTILAAAKRWPVERYAELIGRLGASGERVVVLEGPDEQGVAAAIVAATPDRGAAAVQLRGSLGTAASVLKRAKFYVGTDSGLAHLAAAVGTRAITLFAPADPDRVCPFGQRDLVVRPDKPCSPCFMYPWEATKPKMRCREPFCISEVSVDDVMAKVTQVASAGQVARARRP